MDGNADLEAYDALSQHPRVRDIAALTHGVILETAHTRRNAGGLAPARPIVEARSVAQRAAGLGLAREDVDTPFGNILDVLDGGPRDLAGSRLARALAALAFSSSAGDEEGGGPQQAASDLVWLAAHTPFDATGLLDRAAGPDADSLWIAVAELLRRTSDAFPPLLDRGEALVAALALTASSAEKAQELAATLGEGPISSALANVRLHAVRQIHGEMAPRPRGPMMTLWLMLVGVSPLLHAMRLLGRLTLAYKRPANVVLSSDGSVRVRWRVEMLGRTLREHDVVIVSAGLIRASRSVRYPNFALYAGLLALCVGSTLGISACADGLRAASPSLVWTGIMLLTAGVAMDFVLSSVLPGRKAHCTLLLVGRDGRALCVGEIPIADADGLLDSLT